MGLEGMHTTWTLPFDLFYHVIDDMAVFVLRAEHDNFRVRVDLYVVPRWPVEEIIRFDSLSVPSASVVVSWPRRTKPQ